MTMRIPLTKKVNATLISVYAPTMTSPDDTKENFFNQLRKTLRDIPHPDKLILMGDFNARVRRDYEKWPRVIGRYGVGNCNANGELPLALCSEFELLLTNTVFKQREEHKTTWMHPRSKHWHLIDYIITRQRDRMDVHNTRAMRGANCWTDHQLIRSKIAFAIRPKRRKQGSTKPAKLNTSRLHSNPQRVRLEQDMGKALTNWKVQDGMTVDQTWTSLSEVVYKTANNALGKPERKHQDWFHSEDSELLLLRDKDKMDTRRQHETEPSKDFGQFFDMPKILPQLPKLPPNPGELNLRSYDGLRCPHE